MLKIPEHKSCKGCGACCGPVILNEIEYKMIKFFVKKNKPNFNRKPNKLDCKFRVDGGCSIYPVRPIMCRLMGVTKGMTCAYGNSRELNGRKFLDMDIETVGLINKVIKTDY